jgi:hypothetical protein
MVGNLLVDNDLRLQLDKALLRVKELELENMKLKA